MFRTALISMFLTSTALADTWTVDDDGKADFDNIQAAVDASSDGDEILVYPGTYTSTGDNVVDMMGKAIWLHSSDGPETTIIDGEDVRRVILCNSGETSKTQIEGFTITRGYTNSVSNDFDGKIDWGANPGLPIQGGIRGLPDGLGGGIYTDASPTITNCIISRNWCSLVGGGLDLRGPNCAATITACTISNNISGFDVGGLCCFDSYPTIANCLITENSAVRVGGLLVDHTATITNCIIRNNSEVKTYTGGVYFYGASCTMTETTICGNTQPQTYGDYTDGGGNYIADKCSGDPYGACCVDTSCSIGTAADCSAGGGIYLGDGSSCSGDPCGGGSNVWTVDDSGGADFYDIQSAVNAASDGDEILVYPGTYTNTGDNVVDMMGKALWLHSSAGQEVTFIDGEGARRGILCTSSETNKTIIEGFTVTNGYSTGYGGGMYNNESSPTMTNCTFENNTANLGGGMYNDINSSPALTNCTFTGNAAGYAGGLYNYWDSNPTVTNCTFTNNTASAGAGGGIINYGGSYPTFDDCTFTNNTAIYGGGMANGDSSNPTLTNCTFTSNTANNYGGGMYNIDSNPTLTDTTVCGNTPGQIYGDWTDGGGNYVADTCSGDPTGACCVDTSCHVLTEVHCSSEGGTYLGDGSSCSGDPCGSDCPADTNGDGYVDVSDLLAVIDQWGLTNSPADVNSDGIVDLSDILIVLNNWGPCE